MIGQTIAHYRITAKLGEGGMGEVYQATDDRLNREVAIKVLPDSLAADSSYLTRFQREAQVLASLNHTNIAQVYGLEQQDDRRAIVLELVEGETLAERISRGPVPLEEAREIALQIAQALEAAHEKGIVHRDLKPANVKVAPDGTVKVLDFGLAKALTPEGEDYDMSLSPTITAAATQAGTIMGTAAYMSPEQARGKPVDRRADIWAFGCVLYEMLTGGNPFKGEDVSEVLAHVITREPDLDRLPSDLPTPLRDLIERCLRKDVRMRLPDIGAARIALVESEDAPLTSETGDGPKRTSAMRLVALGAVALAVGLVGGWIVRGGAPTQGDAVATHFELMLDPPLGHSSMTLSADGGTLIYCGLSEGKKQLYRRDLDGFTSEPIAETEGGRWPFFSPDGQKIGFFTAGRLKIVSLQGGLAEPVCAVPGIVQGVIWQPDDQIVYSTRMLPVPHSVNASGGQPRPLDIKGLQPDMRLTFPAALPGYSAFLATLETSSPDDSRVVVVDASDGTMTILVRGHMARYVEPGAVLFLQRDQVMVAPFDLSSRELTGPERPAGLDAPAIVQKSFTEDQFEASVSASGTLLYASGQFAELAELVWVSRDGSLQSTGIEGFFPHLDATGRRALLHHASGSGDVWLVELEGGQATRLTFSGFTTYPRWSRDGKEAVYGYREGAGFCIYSVSVDAKGEPRRLLAESAAMPSIVPNSTHPDGRLMVYAVHPETNRDIWILDQDGNVEPVLQTNANERAAILSPDGSLFAYVSDEDGSQGLFLREFPDSGRRWPVHDQGASPGWSRDGSELFFTVGDAIVTVAIQRDGGLRVGEPIEIFRSDRLLRDDWGNTTFDVAPDGRLLISLLEDQDVRPRLVLGWKPHTGTGR